MTFKAIIDNKGIQRRPGSERKSCISKSTFKIIKKCLGIDNCLSISELSNKIFEEKRVKISSETIRRYLASQHYNCMKTPKFKQYILAIYKKKKCINFEEKNHLDWELAYPVFADEATFYGGAINNRIWIAQNQSYDIIAVNSNIKINVWGAICYSEKMHFYFYKEIK